MRKVRLAVAVGLVAGMLGIGAAVGVGQDDAVPAAAWVIGEVIYAPACVTPTEEFVGEVRQDRGYRCDPQRWTSDDPRLGGDTTVAWNADAYRLAGETISVTSMA